MRIWKHGPRKKSALPKGEASPTPAPAAGAPSAEALAAEVRKLQEQAAALDATLQEARQRHDHTTRRILLGVIDAIDAFERVFASIKSKEDLVTPQMKLWIGNFRTILRLLQRVLTDHGAFPIQDLEGGFDAHRHQALEVIDSSTEPEGTILEEIQKGYLWRDQVLRKASVVVARRASTSAGEDGSAEAVPDGATPKTDGQVPVEGNASSDPGS